MGERQGDPEPGWYAVRCLFRLGGTAADPNSASFEERITLWPAATVAQAVALAETEAERYARDLDDGSEYLGFAQTYHLFDAPGPGAEVFSLVRDSPLAANDYLDAFFDTGTEHQAEL